MFNTTDSGVQCGRNKLASISDAGKVRLGGQGPVFRPAAIKDGGTVRLGGQGPLFR